MTEATAELNRARKTELHHIKVLPKDLIQIELGNVHYLFVDDTFDYQVNDLVMLEELNDVELNTTGKCICRKITHIAYDHKVAISNGHRVLSLSKA